MARTKLSEIRRKADATKKKRRWKPGTVAKRHILKLQRSTNLLIPKDPFKRLVRETLQQYVAENPHLGEMHVSRKAYGPLQEAAEQHLTHIFRIALGECSHRKAETVNTDDLRQAVRIEAGVLSQ